MWLVINLKERMHVSSGDQHGRSSFLREVYHGLIYSMFLNSVILTGKVPFSENCTYDIENYPSLRELEEVMINDDIKNRTALISKNLTKG